MLEVTCSGSPYQIGHQHGKAAREKVHGSLVFYEAMFLRNSGLEWSTATKHAQRFMPLLRDRMPDFVEEMQGVADGAGSSLDDILALNARSELALGMTTDGCTSLALKNQSVSVAGQTWDWQDAQKDRLVLLHIHPLTNPAVSQVTEAGIIGKIGLNSAGVGVFLNAVAAKGVNFDALPVHLGLRLALEAASRDEAIRAIASLGLASSCHVLVADGTGATSLECSAADLVRLDMDGGRIAHTNHFLAPHAETVRDRILWPDSLPRQQRAVELLAAAVAARDFSSAAFASSELDRVLADEQGFPASINRKSGPGSSSSTLFSIVADLRAVTAVVKLGRPTEPEGTWLLRPRAE